MFVSLPMGSRNTVVVLHVAAAVLPAQNNLVLRLRLMTPNLKLLLTLVCAVIIAH